MYELQVDLYDRVRPLYAEWQPYLVVWAVIDGTCPGDIYVDDPDDPQAALLWDHVEGELYLAGGTKVEAGDEARGAALSRALNDCIRHRIRPHAEAHLPHLSEYTLYCDAAAWGDRLDAVLEGLNPMVHRRRLYGLRELRVDWRAHVPEGFTMVPIDEALFARRDLEDMDTMIEWVLGEWRSAAAFAGQERGFCLIHDQDLVSWCASEYTCEPVPGAGKACHVGIYTCDQYRRQGFATLVAAATVEACLASGIEDVGWHCWEANVGSAATAQKVGFELERDQPVYNGAWNPFDNLLLQAYYHSQGSRMPEAVACWERAFEMWEAQDPEALSAPHVNEHPGIVAWCYYAAGRTRAQWGDKEIALAHLHRAVDSGWRDEQALREDEMLVSLRGTPEWDSLLARLGGAEPPESRKGTRSERDHHP